MACAIETLAVDGYARASLARIAQRAGISKGVIVYHFGDKDELFEQVVQEVLSTATDVVGPQLAAAPTATGTLRTYLRARVGFLSTHRQHMLALFELWMNLRTADGRLRLDEADAAQTTSAIESILADGQRAGEFAPLPVHATAMVIRQAIDGVLLELRVRPDLDLDAYAQDLVQVFDHIVRRHP